MRRTRRALPVAVAAAALLAPAAAQAATKTVYAGTPPKGALKGAPATTVDNAFYPARISVHVGDSISFRFPTTPHVVLFPPKGEKSPAFAVPNPAAPVSGATDAAGASMWFNGQPSFGFNPQVAAPAGSKVINGKGLHGSGFVDNGKTKYKLRFAKAGKYTYYCSIHPGMKGTVVVLKRSAKVASKAADAKAIKKQTAAAVKLAKKLAAFAGPSGNAVQAGSDAKGIASLAFFPSTKTIKAGETVTFQFSKTSTEIHNIAFGPADYLQSQAQAFIGQDLTLNPFVVYPSDPAVPVPVTPTSHGNGYAASGLLDGQSSTTPPSKQTFVFPTAGTYSFICSVHPFMHGTITVQ